MFKFLTRDPRRYDQVCHLTAFPKLAQPTPLRRFRRGRRTMSQSTRGGPRRSSREKVSHAHNTRRKRPRSAAKLGLHTFRFPTESLRARRSRETRTRRKRSFATRNRLHLLMLGGRRRVSWANR